MGGWSVILLIRNVQSRKVKMTLKAQKVQIKFGKVLWLIYSIFRIVLYLILSPRKNLPRHFTEQPCIYNGYGKIQIDRSVKVGEWNSPNFFSTYAYMESRNPKSYITIGKNTKINNGFKCIALDETIEI